MMKKSSQKISFAEAAKFLKGFIDLEKEKKKAIKLYQKWGLIKALVDAKLIKTDSDLNTVFEKVKFKKTNLQNLKKRIQKEKFMPQILFIPPLDRQKFNLGDLYQVLFEKNKISYFDLYLTERVLDFKLKSLKKIDLQKIPLKKLKESKNFIQRQKFLAKSFKKTIYKKLNPEILFTHKGLFPDRDNPNKFDFEKDFKAIQQKKLQIISVPADFILRKIQSENINKSMPFYGNSIDTVYLDILLPNGEFLAGRWKRDEEKKFRFSLETYHLPLKYSDLGDFGLRTLL